MISTPGFGSQEWTLVEKQDKIQLYSGSKPIDDIYPYKAKVWLPYTIPEILAVFLDSKRKKEWVPRLWETWIENESIKTGTRIEYAEILIPWPFQNRDVLVKIETKVFEDINHIVLLATSVQNDRIIKASAVRAIVHPSRLTLKWDPIKKETSLETVAFTDPRGYIPAWIVNLFQKTEAVNLVESLRKQLAKNLYSKEYLLEIKEGLEGIRKQ